jgi:hypothetical protein
MSNPLSAVLLAVDRQIEAISDRAFESAAAPVREELKEPLTEREHLLQAVRDHRATEQTPGVTELIDDGLVRHAESGELALTGFADYLLPDAAPQPADEGASTGVQTQA